MIHQMKACSAIVATLAISTATMAQTVVERLLPSVVQIEATDAAGDVVSTGSGFVVESPLGPVVVTNFHVLQNRQGAFARPAVDEDERIRLEPLGAFRVRDLAILRPTDDRAFESAGVEPAELELAAMPGDAVWAIGYPKGLGLTVSRGIVSGLRTQEHLPERYQSDDLKADTVLLQTDAAINSGNSCWPLANDDGLIIGVNTLVLTDGQGLFLAVAARHVEKAIEAIGADAIAYSEFQVGAVQQVASTPNELPSLDVPQNRPSRVLVSEISRIKRGIMCRRCDGTGSMRKRVANRTSRQSSGSYSYQNVSCTVCERSRVQTSRAIERDFGSLLETLASVENDDDFRSRAQVLADALIERALPVEQGLREPLGDWLSRLDSLSDSARVGKPFMVTGFAAEVFDDELYLVRTEFCGDVLIASPRVMFTRDREQVIAGGLIAGTTEIDGDELLVLEHGLIVAD